MKLTFTVNFEDLGSVVAEVHSSEEAALAALAIENFWATLCDDEEEEEETSPCLN